MATLGTLLACKTSCGKELGRPGVEGRSLGKTQPGIRAPQLHSRHSTRSWGLARPGMMLAAPPKQATDLTPTRTVQAALNAARRAEQRVERLSKDEQTTHAQWDAYVKAMKQSYVKEKKRFQSRLEKLRKEQAEALDQLEVAREAFRSIVVDAPMSGAPQDGGSTPGPALVDPYMAMAMMQQGHLPFPPTLTAWGLTVDGAAGPLESRAPRPPAARGPDTRRSPKGDGVRQSIKEATKVPVVGAGHTSFADKLQSGRESLLSGTATTPFGLGMPVPATPTAATPSAEPGASLLGEGMALGEVGAQPLLPDGRHNLLAHATIEDDDLDLSEAEGEPPPPTE